MALRVGLRALLESVSDRGSLEIVAEAATLDAGLLRDVDLVLVAGDLPLYLSGATAADLPPLLWIGSDPAAAAAFIKRWPGGVWGALDENSSPDELSAA